MSTVGVLFIYFLTAYALSNMVVYATGPFHVFEFIRKTAAKIHPHLGELFDCMICFPWWCGFMFSLLNFFLFPIAPLTPFNILLTGAPWWVIGLFDGLVTSGGVWLIHTLQEMMERLSI